jgi:predicted chitinase/LysM repeat protein
MAVHQIKWGDTLSALARRYNTTVSALARANKISNPDKIYAGRALVIPDGWDGTERRTGADRRGGPRPGTAPTGDRRTSPTTATTATSGNPGPTTGGVSLAELRRIMPNLPEAKARQYLPHLNQAMAEAKINTPKRQSAFLAQLAHESVQLRYFEEIASGAAYEGRRDLGNTQAGDGRRFKGRGPIQLTGRANYRAAGRALGIDLENNPQRAADPSVGFRVAAWYWNTRNLNSYADAGNFSAITYRINGGYNGAADRNRYYQVALGALA